ncbi:MAG: hypothetical protein HZY74_13565 [Brevundimonas sp.]|nr:MAG: hypothetical protein HZY74_13565 [Brevundimonas sp.]
MRLEGAVLEAARMDGAEMTGARLDPVHSAPPSPAYWLPRPHKKGWHSGHPFSQSISLPDQAALLLLADLPSRVGLG